MYGDDFRKVYGPYDRKDGRQHVIIVYNDGHKRTVSYPKYLMECHLNRQLDPIKETIDHIDSDFTNNRLENLRVIDKRQHAKEDVDRVKLEDVVCVWCKTQFKRRPNRHWGKAGPFCSKRCSGLYGQRVQMGDKKLPGQLRTQPKYYKLKDL